MRILIAEDDVVTRALLRRLLSNLSHEVVEAADGLEALEKLESSDPDMLLTDLSMPNLDGRTLVETIRQSKTYGQLPIVCMSAVKDRKQIIGLISLGIQDYLLKPIRPSDVHERIRRVIGQHGSWRRRVKHEGQELLLHVDPDSNFRDFAKGYLEPTFSVIGASSGAHAVRLFREADVKPSVVLVAKGLPLVTEARLAQFIHGIAQEADIQGPAFWLCSDGDALPAELASGFVGHIRRSFVPDTFTAELSRTLLRGADPNDELTSYLRTGARSWLISSTQQTLGVMCGQEVNTIAADTAGTIEGGIASRMTLTGPSSTITLTITCARETALGLVEAVLGPGNADESAAGDVFGELSNTIAGRARGALSERGLDFQIGLPSIVTDYRLEMGPQWYAAEWFETTSGQRFFVGLAS